jgi:hypothetical protein
MVSQQERNQALVKLLRPGARPAESFARKVVAVGARIHKSNWVVLGFFLACIAIAWGRW